jgi:energy-coupling factor transporter ATP-binding protein EcfA2
VAARSFRDHGEGRLGRFAELAARVLSEPARLGGVRVVAVDGPTGAGKTTFADRLAGAIRRTGATVEEIHTDDLLDGWDDMVTFWPRLEHDVLARLRTGQPGGYRRYDWHAGRFTAEVVPVPVPDVLVLEGVTSARRVIRPELTLAVFVTAPRDLRLARSLTRDGEELRPHLLRWLAEEAAHFAADRTVDAVDVLVDGAPGEPHDPRTEYLRRALAGGRSGGQQTRGGNRP